jgi:death-on-curing protein
MVVPLSEELVKKLHEAVLAGDPQAIRGYRHEGMVRVCIERPFSVVYGFEPFKTVVDKAAALMFSVNTFHPFNDGCRRTSLLATYFFLLFNGYHFTIRKDMITLTSKIAKRELKNERAVARLIRQSCTETSILLCPENISDDEPLLTRFLLALMKTSWVR